MLKRRLRWEPDDEVITTPLTLVSTNHTILHAGLTPVFADVDAFLCLSPQSVAERITPRTRAVMFVGFRNNWLSNRVFGSYDEIVDHCCNAWNKLVHQPWRILSIGLRAWACGF